MKHGHDLPYRPCVGIMLVNARGQAWVGRRLEDIIGEETNFRWQMPQGGIDRGEDPRAAAFRELQEETGATSAEIVAETRDWLHYDLPEVAIGIALKGKYRGQRMKWFAMRFTGDETEFNIARINEVSPEFDAWRWAEIAELPQLIVPFKRQVYQDVIAEFTPVLSEMSRV